MRSYVGRSVVVAAVVGLLGWIVVAQLDIRSDLSFVFPNQISERTRFLTDRLADPSAQATYLMAIEGGNERGRQRLSLELSRALRSNGSFEKVENGAGASIPDAFDFLFANRYLLGPAWNADEEFSATAISGALKRNLALLATSPGQLLRRYLPADPTGRARDLIAALAPEHGPETHGGIWVSRDGERALLLAQARTESFDLDLQAALLAEIERQFTQLQKNAGYRLRIAGPPGFAVSTRDRIQADVRLLSVLSFLLILLLAWLGFRRPVLVFLLGLPMAIGVLAGLATVQATFGFVHGITLAFGACLVGIAIDYPLHILAHATGDGDTTRSARNIWPTLRLGALTSVAAFLPFMLADFPGLAQIGTFVGAGLVAALFSARFLFPALCPQVDHIPISDRHIIWLRERVNKLRWPLVAMAILAAGIIVLRWESAWETDLGALSPVPRAMVTLDRELRSSLGVPDVRYLIAVRGKSAENVLVSEEKLRPVLRNMRKENQLDGWRMAADILPSRAEQKSRQDFLPDAEVLRHRLTEAIEGTPFKPDAFDPFVADVVRMREADPVTFETMKEGDDAALIESLLDVRRGEFIGVVMLSGIENPEYVGRNIADTALQGVEFVDLKHEANNLVRTFLDAAFWWLLISLLAVVAFLYAGLRCIRAVLGVMAPVMISLFATVGLLTALNIPLSMFHILSLILVAGLGMDYGLFFARHGGEEIVTFRAMILCNLTTAFVFFIMAFSSIPVLHGIGLTVALGSFLALLGSAAFARLSG